MRVHIVYTNLKLIIAPSPITCSSWIHKNRSALLREGGRLLVIAPDFGVKRRRRRCCCCAQGRAAASHLKKKKKMSIAHLPIYHLSDVLKNISVRRQNAKHNRGTSALLNERFAGALTRDLLALIPAPALIRNSSSF